MGEVTKLYVELLALDQQAALRDRLIKVSAGLVEFSRARAQVGEISFVEVNAAALEQAKLEQERANLLAERATRLQSLKPLLGISPEADIQISGELGALTDELSERGGGDKPAWNRPDLRLAALAVEQVEAEQRLAQVEAKGDLTIGVTYGYDRGARSDAAHLLGAKMSIPLPVRNKNQGRLRELRAERSRVQWEADALELRVASEVVSARQRVAQFRQILDGYRASVLPLGGAAEQVLSAAYEQGQVPLFQVIQGQQQRLALEAGAVAAQAAYVTALADLQTATGLNPQLARSASEQPSP